MRPNGYLMVVTPAPEHLLAMREGLFEEVKAHEPHKFVEQLKEHFELIEHPIVESNFELDQIQLKNLIAMTPYAYKAKPEKRLALEAQIKTQLKAAFQIYLFQKK